MSMMDLKPDRSLIDPQFDGYKLSLEHLPIYKIPLDTDVDVVKLRDDQYTYQHVKAFGLHNYIYPDPWTQQVMFVDSDWKIRTHSINQEAPFQTPGESFQIPGWVDLRQRPDRLSVTVHCTSTELLVIGDGTGQLYLVNTGDRKQTAPWKVCYKGCPVLSTEFDDGTPQPFTVLHSVHHSDSSGIHVDILLLHVDRNPEADNENDAPPYLTKLSWITLHSSDSEKWQVDRTRQLCGCSSPDYAAIESQGQAAVIASAKPFHFISDTKNPIEKKSTENGVNGHSEDDKKSYVWTQTAEDVTVFFSLQPDVSKPDIMYKVTANTIEVGVKNSCDLVKGILAGLVDVDSCTWTLSQEHDQNKLEVHLEKQQPAVWSEVVHGDKRGQLVTDIEQLEQIHERLAHFTSDQTNPDPDTPEKPYNSQELEDCDMYTDENASILWFDGDNHEVTHQVHVGSHQWLFNIQSEAEKSPCLCLRHDVDGLVWQPITASEDTSPWKHMATFNAFGYVQASKQQKKFAGCSSDFSYAVICDCARHIYIYRQPSAISSPIRNRKTGREVAALAKQQLISLDTVDDILGLFVANDRLFALVGNTMFMIRVNSEIV